jgi:hypothetical protein
MAPFPNQEPPRPSKRRNGARRGRSRSVNDHQMGGIDSKLSSTTKGGKRHRSTGGIRKNKRSCIRVNSQHESIKRKGLCKKKGGQNCKTEFAFLEVREYPMILYVLIADCLPACLLTCVVSVCLLTGARIMMTEGVGETLSNLIVSDLRCLVFLSTIVLEYNILTLPSPVSMTFVYPRYAYDI